MKTGIFFDGYHCQKFWNDLDKEKKNHDKLYNKLDLTTIIKKITNSCIESGYSKIDVKYKAWFQGIKESHIEDITVETAKEVDLRKKVWLYHNERNLYIHLIRHGIETVFLEHALTEDDEYQEKGIDTALVVNCLKNVVKYNLECVIICTNDSDFEPLIHSLKKDNIFVVIVTFSPKNNVSKRLKRQCDLLVDYKEIINS